jgi:hypothetical protein
MMRRLARVSAILAAGAIVGGALYWALLNTPDSNAIVLGISALLVVLLVLTAAIGVSMATLVARGTPGREAVARVPRAAGWFLIAFSPLLAAWMTLGRFDRWVIERQGEINAWFIARFGWADISWLLRAEVWASRWIRWAVVPVLCISLLTTILTAETGTTWLRRAFHWRTLLAATLAFIVLMALPWQLTTWRPQLPPTWVQPTLAAIRLGTTFVFGILGFAVLILFATRDRT